MQTESNREDFSKKVRILLRTSKHGKSRTFFFMGDHATILTHIRCHLEHMANSPLLSLQDSLKLLLFFGIEPLSRGGGEIHPSPE
jgi:hypothetical protein